MAECAADAWQIDGIYIAKATGSESPGTFPGFWGRETSGGRLFWKQKG